MLKKERLECNVSTLDRCEDSGYVVDRTPLVLKNVEADFPVGVDVRVEHLRHEPNLRATSVFFLTSRVSTVRGR